MVDAKKRKMGEKEALALAGQVDTIHATRGTRVITIDMKAAKPDAATLKSLLIGPSGNLRAPTLRVGRTLLVGFDEAAYRKVLAK